MCYLDDCGVCGKGKKVLDKGIKMVFNIYNTKTVEAEIKLRSASAESPRWWKRGEKRGSKWTAEGRGKGET